MDDDLSEANLIVCTSTSRVAPKFDVFDEALIDVADCNLEFPRVY